MTVRSNSKLGTTTIKNDVQGGGYDAIRADDVVVVVVTETQAESIAERKSLTITDRMLLNSVVDVFDNRRRTSFNRDSDERQRSLAERVDAVLYELAKMSGAPGHARSYRGSSMGQTDAGMGIGQGWGEGEADGSMSGMQFDIGDDPGTLKTGVEPDWEQLWGRSFKIPLNLTGEDVSQSEGRPEWTLWGSADRQTATGVPPKVDDLTASCGRCISE